MSFAFICSFRFHLAESSRVINCDGKREIDSFTEIFDLLAFNVDNSVGSLILSRREIVSLPVDAFRGLKQLQSLNLSENSLVTIEADVFEDLSILEELDFSHNQLLTLSGTAFKNIQSLLKLNLSNNRIGDLNDTTGNQLPNLTHLDLSHNKLITIDGPFVKSLSSLKFLDISYNEICSLASGTMLQLRSLLVLAASNNKLSEISGEYFPASLESLRVGHNIISALPESLSRIQELSIEDNEIFSLEANVSWFRALKHFNISGNELIELPDVKFENLKILDITRNRFTIAPSALKSDNFPMLEELTIGGNPIRILGFKSELRLRKLIVRGLDLLETIEVDTFRNLKSHVEGCINLTVSENSRLSKIEKGAFDDIAICTLDLSGNAFTRISPEVIKSADQFVAEYGINLQMNPFNCNCEAQWMLNDLVPHLYTINPELLEDLRCATPPELSGTRMVHWFKWQKRVFCDTSPQVLSKMTVDTAAVLAGGENTIRLESSRGMLAIIAGSMGTLCILIIVGIMTARRVATRRRRINRRL